MSLPLVGPRKLLQLHQYHVFEVGVAAATLQPHYAAAPESSERSCADLIHSRSLTPLIPASWIGPRAGWQGSIFDFFFFFLLLWNKKWLKIQIQARFFFFL